MSVHEPFADADFTEDTELDEITTANMEDDGFGGDDEEDDEGPDFDSYGDDEE